MGLGYVGTLPSYASKGGRMSSGSESLLTISFTPGSGKRRQKAGAQACSTSEKDKSAEGAKRRRLSLRGEGGSQRPTQNGEG